MSHPQRAILHPNKIPSQCVWIRLQFPTDCFLFTAAVSRNAVLCFFPKERVEIVQIMRQYKKELAGTPVGWWLNVILDDPSHPSDWELSLFVGARAYTGFCPLVMLQNVGSRFLPPAQPWGHPCRKGNVQLDDNFIRNTILVMLTGGYLRENIKYLARGKVQKKKESFLHMNLFF